MQHVVQIATDDVDVLENEFGDAEFIGDGRWDHVQFHVGESKFPEAWELECDHLVPFQRRESGATILIGEIPFDVELGDGLGMAE